jgi:hypothetical protein
MGAINAMTPFHESFGPVALSTITCPSTEPLSYPTTSFTETHGKWFEDGGGARQMRDVRLYDVEEGR